MPRRSILTERQRSALFDLPTDDPSMLHHYTLADDDLEHINDRRRSENKIGFALQLCALRYPGRLLSSDEVIPEKVLRFIVAQLGLTGDDILPYATRRQTRQQHLHALRQIYGFKMFSGQGARCLKAWLAEEAETARSNGDLARRFVEECRRTQTILPGVTVIERLGADALVAAERRIETRIAARLDDQTSERLDAFLTEIVDGKISRFVWLRQFEVGNNSAGASRLLGVMEPLPQPARKSITFDRGIEFRNWRKLKPGIGTEAWFCDPQAPWQKGYVDNLNKRARRYLPRDAPVAALSNRDMKSICDRLNGTPRKCLGWRTPTEAFREELMKLR